MNSYVEDFREALKDAISRVNADVYEANICEATPTLIFYPGDIILLGARSCYGNKVYIGVLLPI